MASSSPSLPDLTIRQCEYLVAAVDASTWAQAAASVGVSPSALSQGLAEMERRLGVPIFDREGRRRILRAGAAPVVAHARQVLALTSDLARWVDRAREGEAGHLRLGMIDVAAVHHHADALRRFREIHPDLEIRLRVAPSGGLVDDLVSGDLDLVVCVEPSTSIPGVTTEALLTEELAIYRPEGTAAGPPADWGPWVLFPEGSHTRAVIATALAEAGAELEVVAESHQPDVLQEMVNLGLGWTVLPTVQAETGLRPLVGGKVLTTRRLVLAQRVGAVPDPAREALAAALREAPGTSTGHGHPTAF